MNLPVIKFESLTFAVRIIQSLSGDIAVIIEGKKGVPLRPFMSSVDRLPEEEEVHVVTNIHTACEIFAESVDHFSGKNEVQSFLNSL